MLTIQSITGTLLSGVLFVAGLGAGNEVAAQDQPAGDAAQGKVLFQQSCAICHADISGPGNTVIVRQGPSLVGVFGRPAGTGLSFSYTKALTDSGLTWDAATLDHFLTNPAAAVPGTTMPISVADAQNRLDLIAYLKTLRTQENASPVTNTAPASATTGDPGDWHHAAPGVPHHITVADLPPPYATVSVGNGPKGMKQPPDATLSVPAGFTVRLFATGLSNPRLLRTAPNGDIFVAETGADRIRVLRATDGADAPTENEVYAAVLDRPFGLAFYPPGKNPHWLYVANNNSVVRFAYHNGDLTASGPPEVIVPKLTDSHGGHSTRDVAFSLDGKRMFISVGSGSNIADGMSKKSVANAQAWEAEHGLGAAWDSETNRADILVTDPEGHEPLHTFATGIRNGVGIAVNPATGDLWTSVNERDGLGDDLVPDYITRVKEGGFYGWPWYYMGDNEEPRLKGDRPDLAGHVIVPDVLLQAHSASLEMTFYTATKGVAAFPAEYHGDAFAAEHGSWNRSSRTGYKVIRVRLNDGVPTGEYDDFLTGFVVDNRSVWGRPVGVTVAHDGALLVTEDGNGTIWRVSYTGP
jgi:glucose/arabinose dehydrogenase